MTKDEMAHGFKLGKTLIQEEWSFADEIMAADELVLDGLAYVVDDWRYFDGFQCERRILKGVSPEPRP